MIHKINDSQKFSHQKLLSNRSIPCLKMTDQILKSQMNDVSKEVSKQETTTVT